MSGQAPTNRFRGILDCTGEDGEQEAAEEGEVCIPVFPNLFHPPGSLISAGGDRRCSPCCSFMLEWCVMNRAVLIPGICNNSAGAPGSHCNGRTRARTGTSWKEPKKEKKGKAPKPQRMGTPFSSLSSHFGVSREPFPVTPGMDSAVEPPWDRQTCRSGKQRGFFPDASSSLPLDSLQALRRHQCPTAALASPHHRIPE